VIHFAALPTKRLAAGPRRHLLDLLGWIFRSVYRLKAFSSGSTGQSETLVRRGSETKRLGGRGRREGTAAPALKSALQSPII
jgi:hypothetical protein